MKRTKLEKKNIQYRDRGLKNMLFGGLVSIMVFIFFDYIKEIKYLWIIFVVPLTFFTIMSFYWMFIKWDFTKGDEE
jgi:FtsH-binding integral membrane protein